MSLVTATNVAVALVVAAWLWSMLNWVLLRPMRLERFLRKQGISGNAYRFFHGDMKQIQAMRAEATCNPMPTLSHDYLPRLRPFLHHTIQRYGKNCLMWNGPIPVVNIGEVELVREILGRYNEFQKPRSNPIISRLLICGLISYEGQKWAHHRKLLNPAFHMHKLKLMVPAFYTSCSEMVRMWDDKLCNSEHEIDVSGDLTTLSADTISRAAFGSSYEEGKRIFELIKEILIVADEIGQSVYFPGLRFLPTEKNRKMNRIDREIKSLLTGIIEKRKESRELRDDLLGLLMESNLQNSNEEEDKDKKKKQKIIKITTEEMIDECKLFYLAGQETTSALLTWTMILLSKHQDWQSKARQEVLNAFGLHKPDFDALNHLKTMNMVFQEVMRLYPPVIELRRTVAEDSTKLGSLTLPSGSLVNLPVLYMHQDCEVWGDDAKEFNPERFARGISKASKGGVSFLAFGWGPRICIGSNFAMVEAKIALSMILQRFQFQLSPSYVHAPTSNGLLYPQFGAPLVFRRL
ncbi:hypothetical protein V2J09_015287 [Rumex salicifolius]